MNLLKISQYGLVSTAIAALCSFFILFIINNSLSVDESSHVRYVYNWAVSLSVLACLGWDSAIVRAARSDAYKLFQFSSTGIPTLCLLALFCWYFVGGDYLLIAIISFSFMSVLIRFNYVRSVGRFEEYILGINVYDKLLRLFLVIVGVYFFEENVLSFFVCCYLIFYLFSSDFDLSSIFQGAALYCRGLYGKLNVGFLFAGAYMVFMSRGIYLIGDDLPLLVLREIDFSLLMSAFLFVPIQTIVKYHEVGGGNNKAMYLTDSPSRVQYKVIMLEFFVFIGVIGAGVVLSDYFIGNKIDTKVLCGVLAITVLMSTFPNPVQVLTVNQNYWGAGVVVLVLASVVLFEGYFKTFEKKLLLYTFGVAFSFIFFCIFNWRNLSLNFSILRLLRTVFFMSLLFLIGYFYE